MHKVEIIKKLRLIPLLVLFILGFICFGNLNGSFLYDDEHFIQKNKTVHKLDIGAIYSESVTEGTKIPSNFYRPNQQLVYSLIYSAFKDSTPVPYHLASLLFHISNSFLILLLLASLGFRQSAQLAGAILYLIHPVQTEAVSYISGLSDPLGMLFLMLMLLTFQHGMKSKEGTFMPLRLLGIAALTTLALLSKENFVISFPLAAILLMNAFYTGIVNRKFAFSALGVVFCLVLTYLALKFTVFNFTPYAGLTGESNAYTESLWMRIITFLTILWDYLVLILYPIDLSYTKPYTAYASIFTLKGGFGLLTMALLLYLLLKAKKHPHAFLAYFWFFAALGPFTGIVPLNAIYLEHWLYVPFAGVSIFVALLFEKISSLNWQRPLLIISAVIGALLCTQTIARHNEWGDIEKFYLNELEHGKSAVMHNNLAMHYADIENFALSEDHYKQAIALNDSFPQSHHNLARIYLRKNDVKSALREYRNALRLSPRFIYTFYDLHNLFRHLKLASKAEKVRTLIMKVEQGETYPTTLIEELFTTN